VTPRQLLQHYFYAWKFLREGSYFRPPGDGLYGIFDYQKWRIQEFCSGGGGGGSTNLVEDRGHRERESGGW
jgi:hypothetical protein